MMKAAKPRGVQVDDKRGDVTLRLNPSFYSKRAVLGAAKLFSEHFFVMLYEEREGTTVNLKPRPAYAGQIDPEVVGREFCNHALGLMQEAA